MKRWALAAGLALALAGGVRAATARTELTVKKGEQFTNTLGMRFIRIEPGTFVMGSPDGKRPPDVPEEEQRQDGETPHTVTLTKGYYFGACLVTQHQWEQVMGKEANRSRFKASGDDEKKKLPADSVSWDDCQEFCRRLSTREGRKYRLPTEAEWEYACRAGTKTPFWWGDTIHTDRANYNGDYRYGRNGEKGTLRKKTTPVDFFRPSPWCLHDMHGNLWQWCEDWYELYGEGESKDPVRTVKGDWDGRVRRGGSWCDPPDNCRSASRGRGAPARREAWVGCRVVLCPD
jgi:formylglycine-generating enzyme required for sulfatase activity